MDPLIGASLIGAGSSLIGGLFGSRNQASANALNREMAERNIALQKEFAQQGVRWKVEDAKAAGVHPLYALGAPTVSFSPVSAFQEADRSIPAAMADIGQDLSRAVSATRTKDERLKAHLDALSLERGYLENDLLRAQIAKINQAGMPPAFPGRLPERGELPHAVSEWPGVKMPFGMVATGLDTPSQVVQDEYGDLVEVLHGTTRFTKDALKSFYDWIPVAVDRALPQRRQFIRKHGYSGFDAMP